MTLRRWPSACADPDGADIWLSVDHSSEAGQQNLPEGRSEWHFSVSATGGQEAMRIVFRDGGPRV